MFPIPLLRCVYRKTTGRGLAKTRRRDLRNKKTLASDKFGNGEKLIQDVEFCVTIQKGSNKISVFQTQLSNRGHNKLNKTKVKLSNIDTPSSTSSRVLLQKNVKAKLKCFN